MMLSKIHSLFLSLILLCLFLPHESSADNECGTNEEYTSCSSSTCFEKTCEDVLNPQVKACSRDCKQGCKCMTDFARIDGNCEAEALCNGE
mmetsp:Transcript_5787/g.6731  ORF Transcript_5787/g.6731 Transcript_5787/m.6731 type:complete len:91 (+) Transcript_5787:103-375(+)